MNLSSKNIHAKRSIILFLAALCVYVAVNFLTYTLYSITQISLTPVVLAGGGGAGGAGGAGGGDVGSDEGGDPGAESPSVGDPDAPSAPAADAPSDAPADAPTANSPEDTTGTVGQAPTGATGAEGDPGPADAPSAGAPSTTGCDGCDPEEGLNTAEKATPADFGVFGVVGPAAVGLAQAANQANEAANAATAAAQAANATASRQAQEAAQRARNVEIAVQNFLNAFERGVFAPKAAFDLGVAIGLNIDSAISDTPAPSAPSSGVGGPEASVISAYNAVPIKFPQIFDFGIPFSKKNKTNSNYTSLNPAIGLFRNPSAFDFSFFPLRAAVGDVEEEASANLLGFLKRTLNELQKPFNEDARRIEFAGDTGRYTLASVLNIASDSIDTFEELNALDPIFLELLEALETGDTTDTDNAASIFDALKNFGRKNEALSNEDAANTFFKVKEIFAKTIFETITAVEKQVANIVARREAAASSAVIESEKPKTLIDAIKESFTGKKEETKTQPSSDSRPTAPVVFREPPPEVEFTVSRGDAKGVAILRWNSNGAQNCVGSNFQTYNEVKGETHVMLTETTTYTLTCTALRGSKTIRSIIISTPTSPSVPLPTVTLNASSDFSGREITLSWKSTNATSCTGTPFETNGETSGSVSITQTASTKYTLTCTGPGGSQTRTAAFDFLKESELSQNLTITLRHVRNEAILTWTAPLSNCTISGTDGFLFTTETNTGSVNAGPLKSGTTYTINCKVEQGQIAD